MEKFTKSEWQYEQYAFGDKRVLSEGSVVAIIACTDVGDEQCEANAALIAAAPKMYEMLDSVSEILFIVGQSKAANQVVELLAKARGEQ